MRIPVQWFTAALVAGITLANSSSSGFSLLGPYEPWMTARNGFRRDGDIGGPMDAGSEYRWNIPVVTYGFDRSFLDFFGSKGVAAVESAIKIINDLPPASGIVLTNYPAQSQRLNYQAQALGLMDLKSQTLALLLEHLGLAQPRRSIFNLRRWDPSFINSAALESLFGPFTSAETDWPPDAVPNLITERNYDPLTFAASHYVNETLLNGLVFWSGPLTNAYPSVAGVTAYTDQVFDGGQTAVADNSFKIVSDNYILVPNDFNFWLVPGLPLVPAGIVGGYYTGLTRDDVGGLRYLLSKNNVNYEHLLPGVRAKVNGAWRQGVEKIRFVRHPYETRSDWFPPKRYEFVDTYIAHGRVLTQKVSRTVTQPDFIFCAGDTGERHPFASLYARSGTTNWIKNAPLNGSATAGPGVIRPPVKITFQKLGPTIFTHESFESSIFEHAWGSFDGSTNDPVVFPDQPRTGRNQFTLRLRFYDLTNGARELTNHTWHLKIPVGQTAALQLSTNQTDWTTLATVANSGAVTEWFYYGRDNPHKFFRVLAE